MKLQKFVQCEGKVQMTAKVARDAAKRRIGRSAYRCKFCGFWHVGRNPLWKNSGGRPKIEDHDDEGE